MINLETNLKINLIKMFNQTNIKKKQLNFIYSVINCNQIYNINFKCKPFRKKLFLKKGFSKRFTLKINIINIIFYQQDFLKLTLNLTLI